MKKRAGAPKGGRVHSIVWDMLRIMKRHYKIRYNYEFHNYWFECHGFPKKRQDQYIVIKRPRSWHVTYHDRPTKNCSEESFARLRDLEDWIYAMYEKKKEQEEEYERAELAKLEESLLRQGKYKDIGQ